MARPAAAQKPRRGTWTSARAPRRLRFAKAGTPPARREERVRLLGAADYIAIHGNGIGAAEISERRGFFGAGATSWRGGDGQKRVLER